MADGTAVATSSAVDVNTTAAHDKSLAASWKSPSDTAQSGETWYSNVVNSLTIRTSHHP
jgi:hypothetical protein